MTNHELFRFAGWSAVGSAIATILGLLTLLLFYALGQPWGTINDITSIILALSILPVLLVLHRLHRRQAPQISLAVFVISILAMLVAVVFQVLLISRVIGYAQTAEVVPVAFGLFGAALIVYGYLSSAARSLPRRLALLSIISGAGYVMVIAGVILGGEDHPLTAIGGLTAVIGYSIWAIWFGRILLSGKLAT